MAKKLLLLRPLSLIFSIFITFYCIPIHAQTEPESIAELQSRSDKGDREAQNLLGIKYYTGDGIPKNELQAAELFTRAARQGLKTAQFNLGYMYHQGLGVPQNYIQACVWYKAAADQGHSEARASFDYLKPYLSDENLDSITRLSSQIPAIAITAADENPDDNQADPVRLGEWIKSIQPAAGN